MSPSTRYPVYVVSKGRSERCLTSKFLARDGVEHRVVVEPQERDAYASAVGPDRLLVLPFSNLGLGSIPARNWIWDHAIGAGAKRHWILDDNITRVRRSYLGKRVGCDSRPALSAIEDFVDRYENVAIAGLNDYKFVFENIAAYYLNVHVYSSLLIDSSLPIRWRGRYNEDTDLCLQALSRGHCTILSNVFLMEKMTTMAMKGGNTDELYAGDGRLRMSCSLERAWPYVVSTKRKFKRPQHHVRDNWRHFDTPLRLRPDVDLSVMPSVDEYGLALRATETAK